MSLQTHPTSDRVAPAGANLPESLDILALTRRMVQGQEAAYRTFYDVYFDRLFRYLLVVASGDEEAAREALQAALVRVVRHIKVFTGEAAFWGWLTVVGRSALADHRRKRRRYLAFLERFTWHSRVQRTTDHDPEADVRLARLLHDSLDALSFDERQLVEAKYCEGRTVRAVAREVNLSEKAVESRLVRIRQKLKAAILDGLKHE